MKILSLNIENFRSYERVNLELGGGITLLSGKNAQGKTNLVESFVFASTTKSPRTSDASELILNGKDACRVDICLERAYGKVNVGFMLSRKGEKRFFINGNEVKKLSEVFGNLVVVYFCPQDLRIVSDSPQERRDFMDTDLSQLSGSYYNLLSRYNKVLMQRNKLLKFEKDRVTLLGEIDVFNEQLASLAALIIKTRKNFIEKLKNPARDAMRYISGEKDELKIEYVGARGATAEEIKAELLRSLKQNLERDLELGYTTIGPHRDDILFTLNGKDARAFSSQGQQRSIVLALKFAEMEIFSEQLGEPPVLILDDVFSELDSGRQKKLYEHMQKYQCLLTGTLFRFKPSGEYKRLVIENGKIKERKT